MATAKILKSDSALNEFSHKAGIALLGGLRFAVEKGMHAGAKLASPTSDMTIGSAAENDVVLLGDSLAGKHVRLSVINPWRQIVRIEAQQQPVSLADGRQIAAGRYIDVTLPVRFRVGTAECRAEAIRQVSAARRYAVPAIVLLLAAVVLPWLTSLFGASPNVGRQTNSSATFNSAMTGNGSGEKWQASLNDRLKVSGLGAQISVERGASGSLVAVGSIEESETEKWRDVIKWYDSQGAVPLLVNNVTHSGVMTVVPQIRAVWFDIKPQIVLLNGQSAGIGETIGSGWKIEAIDAQGVLLSRDGKTARITF